MDRGQIVSLLRALWEADVDYVLIGGLALNLHGLVRATEDIDLLLDPSADNVNRLRSALRSIYADPEVEKIEAAELAGKYPVVRYVPPGGNAPLDLIARLGTAFAFQDAEWLELDLEGVPVRVATPESLYAMKHRTGARDREDARRLAQAFGSSWDSGEEDD
ncbi:MAG TPA: nucleotidyl transferase AbiEii/AbiGii toxin family protein [Trueperaceae bacterium]